MNFPCSTISRMTQVRPKRAAALLPERLPDILDRRLDKRNFRRRILGAGIIEPTAHLRSGEGRPARLYRYRPDAVAEVKARRLFP